jgi:hypothetical protein
VKCSFDPVQGAVHLTFDFASYVIPDDAQNAQNNTGKSEPTPIKKDATHNDDRILPCVATVAPAEADCQDECPR